MALRALVFTGMAAMALALTACGGGNMTEQPVTQPNRIPTAQLTAPAEGSVGEVITLDGRASVDADGDALTYTWSVVSKPATALASVSADSSGQATFTADAAGTYVMALVVGDGKGVSVAAATTYTAYTSLAGSITQATVLTKAQSPYRLTADVLVAEDASLTVSPGVTIDGKSRTLRAHGAVVVQGNSAELVNLKDLTVVWKALVAADRTPTNCRVSIAFANITGGGVYPSQAGFSVCPLSLTDSRLTGAAAIDIVNGWGDFVIERNVFDKTGGVSFEIGRSPELSSMTVRNNRFVDWVGDYALRKVGQGLGPSTVRSNSFVTPGRIAVVLQPDAQGAGTLDASQNFWGTVDSAAILAMTSTTNPQGLTVFPALAAPDSETP
jgi:PKD domain